jgi:hypothetical protein
MDYMVHGSKFQSNVKNQESTHLTPFHVVTMPYGTCGGHIVLRTSNDVFIFNMGLCFEGLF